MNPLAGMERTKRSMWRQGRFVIAGIALFVLGMGVQESWAWGPATHVKLAYDVLSELALLAPAVAVLLRRCARDFVFGSIAADVVFAKRMSRVKQSCHQWPTAFAILDAAPNDPTRAFAMGYLAHLAADTVAHNKFLPRQMTVTRSTMSFGHLYWEARADSSIGTHYWDQLRIILDGDYEQHETVLAQKLTDTLLPFQWNRVIFYRLNTMMSHRNWIRTMDAWCRRSRWDLPDSILAEYRRECVERAIDILTLGPRSAVAHDDPNGTAAIGHTRERRRQHRKMARAGILLPHVLREATAVHAPVTGRRNGNGSNGNHDSNGQAAGPAA